MQVQRVSRAVLYLCLLALLLLHSVLAKQSQRDTPLDTIASRAHQRDTVFLKNAAIDQRHTAVLPKQKGKASRRHHNNKFFAQNEQLEDANVKSARHPVIVKLKENVIIDENLRKKLFQTTGIKFNEYIPHKSFLVHATDVQLEPLHELEEVQYVADYKPEFKVSAELNDNPLEDSQSISGESIDEDMDHISSTSANYLLQGRKKVDNSSKHRKVMIAVFLMEDDDRSMDDTIQIFADLDHALKANKIPVVAFQPVSQKKIVVSLKPKHVAKATQILSHHSEVHWIEHMSPVGVRENWDVRYVLQSGVQSRNPFTEAGITGKKQIIAFADSGLDVYHCFFHDNKNPVPFHTATNVTSSIHRKLAGYNTFMDGLDDTHGHGTHIGGTLAGISTHYTPLNKYAGHAPDAKLAVFDLGCQTKGGCKCSGPSCPCIFFPNGKCPEGPNLYLPFDLSADYFPWAYKVGARIHSNSIGGSIGFGYTGTTREIDSFMYDHPDFLVFWSAGNSGRNEGYMTLTGPVKQAKNAVVVGCSTNPLSGWKDVLTNFRDYEARAKLLKAAVEQQGFCNCSTSCNKYACNQAKKLISEEGCCEVFDKCMVDHPEQKTNPQANVVLGCCRQCALKALNEEKSQLFFQEQNMAIFSSLGPAVDGRIKPDLVAPGFLTLSAKSHASNPDETCTAEKARDLNSNIKEMGGTSMATPAAAAAGALVRDYFMQGFYPLGEPNTVNTINPSAALVKAVLLSSARSMTGIARAKTPFSAYPTSQRRYFEGFGLINLSNTLYLAGMKHGLFISDNHKISTDSSHTFTVDIPENGEFTATLVWTDPPGSPVSSISLVNDLDLTITKDKTDYIGNADSATAKDYDRLNNVEKVIIRHAEAGKYRVTVSGYNIPQGPQSYALVITGPKLNPSHVQFVKQESQQKTVIAPRIIPAQKLRDDSDEAEDTVLSVSDSVAHTTPTPAGEPPVSWFYKDISIKPWLLGVIVIGQALIGMLLIVGAGIAVYAFTRKKSQ